MFILKDAIRAANQARVVHKFKDRDSHSEAAVKAVKKYAKAHGFAGAQGGWIYNVSGRPIVQGWWAFFGFAKRDLLDWATRELTAFDSFRDLTDRTYSTYRPTIRNTQKDVVAFILAQEYDAEMAFRGDARRAYRVAW